MKSTKDVVIKVLSQKIKNKKSSILPESTLKEDLGIDSMQLVLIISSTCNKLKIKLEDLNHEQLLEIKSVNDLISVFQSCSN